jgi:hypothetical protein
MGGRRKNLSHGGADEITPGLLQAISIGPIWNATYKQVIIPQVDYRYCCRCATSLAPLISSTGKPTVGGQKHGLRAFSGHRT